MIVLALTTSEASLELLKCRDENGQATCICVQMHYITIAIRHKTEQIHTFFHLSSLTSL